MTAALLVEACTPGAPSSTAPAATAGTKALDSVTIRAEGDWPHLDVLGILPGSGSILQRNYVRPFYDTMIVTGPDPSDPSKSILLPYLATKWEQTPDKITFTMRKDATCSDGTPVTPSLVKQNVDLRLAKGSSVANALGPGPFMPEADDAAGTFTLRMGTPFTDALYFFLTFYIACPAALKDPTVLAEGAAGSGPYVLESAEHGNQMVLKRRDDWKWGPAGITAKDIPAKVIVKVVTNETTAANLLATGGLDIGKIGGTDITRLLAEPSLRSKTTTGYYDYYLVFNQDPSRPTSDVKIREALVAAIDQNAYNQAANQGRGEVSPSFLMPKADCFDPKTADLLPKNPGPDKTKQILLDAGWSLGTDGKLQKDGKPLVIEFTSSTVPGIGFGAEYLADQWTKAGITVDARISADFNTFIQMGAKSDFDALTSAQAWDQPNPNGSLSITLGKAPPNGSNWTKSNQVDIEKEFTLATSTVGDERCQHWANVQEMLLKNYAIWGLATPNNYWFARGIDWFVEPSVANLIYMRPAAK
jgi:peptide/nickel transport system substrate-binding protein